MPAHRKIFLKIGIILNEKGVTVMTESEIVERLRSGLPFEGLPQVSVEEITIQPRTAAQFDAVLTLNAGGQRVPVMLELKNFCTPRATAQIVPWLAQLKRAQPRTAFALVCPRMSPDVQRICAESNVDFIDLAGNVFINVPGTLYLYRTGMKGNPEDSRIVFRDPYGGRASRVLRVLLEKRRPWRLSDIASEIAAESERIGMDFRISLASISKTLRSLSEELLVRREDSIVKAADPKRLLLKWAEKYRERYRWRARSSFKAPNPFGPSVEDVARALEGLGGMIAFTGAAAASTQAPYVDVNSIEILADPTAANLIRNRAQAPRAGPDLRVIYPFDSGVFMYRRIIGGLPLASDVQVFLDLYGRGGRDAKQADFLMANSLEPRWRAA
jgi:hypothetical protein